MSGPVRGLVLALALTAVMPSCIVRRYTTGGLRLTGTCAGACDHYAECEMGHPRLSIERCRAECPSVFSDPDSLMAFESMSCKDTVEFVDGGVSTSASSRR